MPKRAHRATPAPAGCIELDFTVDNYGVVSPGGNYDAGLGFSFDNSGFNQVNGFQLQMTLPVGEYTALQFLLTTGAGIEAASSTGVFVGSGDITGNIVTFDQVNGIQGQTIVTFFVSAETQFCCVVKMRLQYTGVAPQYAGSSPC